MKVDKFRVAGIRCFDDTGDIELSPRCNIFVGQNNAGKSTLVKALLGFQYLPFSGDERAGAANSFVTATFSGFSPSDLLQGFAAPPPRRLYAVQGYRGGAPPPPPREPNEILRGGRTLFIPNRPNHVFVPFLAKRKTQQFDQNVTLNIQNQLTGTLNNLYSRIDRLATTGPGHEEFQKALLEIIGLPITTKASQNGKEAGFYIDKDNFVTLDRMGDGVAEMAGLIVELCLERGKVFLLEEPETNLHPKGLKALLSMVRASSEHNQFIIATHSNVVVRELGVDGATKVFRVYRDGQEATTPSHVELIPRTPAARVELLRELGYEFTDLGLHDAWLFLEEASAEQVVNDVLMPFFAPELKGRLRTYSAGGISNVEPGVAEFQRLVVFVHLQPAYEGRLWIRVDSGEDGKSVVDKLRTTFSYLTDETCSQFSAAEFERYYPAQFQERAAAVLAIGNRKEKQVSKTLLLKDVLQWSCDDPAEAKSAWETSAAEPIELLRSIRKAIS